MNLGAIQKELIGTLSRPMSEEETLLTGKELAEKLGVKRATLWRWRRSKAMPHYKIGSKSIYYKLSEVLAWCKK
jgi:excisionase family DNA binding protein